MSEGPNHKPPSAASSNGAATRFDARELAAAAEGQLLRAGTRPSGPGAVDSRLVGAGDVFFALPGDRTDGHRFLENAVAAGAAALVVTEDLPAERLDRLAAGGDVTVVRVADAAAALRSVAATYRDRFDPLVVGITGSLAKTSTKEQVAEVLEERFEVLRNPANWNNEIGLPMTLLRLRPEHEVAVLEMGLYTTGEIALLARLARPSIGVVTAVRGVHLSRAGSIEAIEAGKRELVEALPADGWAILNADDPRVLGMAGQTSARVLTYGFSHEADVRAVDIVPLGTDGMRFGLRLHHGQHEVAIPVLGRHGVHNALAAAAVAACSGMVADDIIRGLARPFAIPHRSQLVTAGGWTILDDSYNASPDAVLAALGLLAELPGRRIAVLGEMLELGDAAAAEHHRVGEGAADVAERLIVVGEGARGIADGAVARGMDSSAVGRVADRDEALSLLLAELQDGDTVLVKASRGAELDLLVDKLVRVAAGREAQGVTGENIVYGILVAFAIVVVLMPAFIRLLKRVGMGKRIRLEGPETHYVKEGTPAMGGLLIVLVVIGIALVMEFFGDGFLDASTSAPLATLAFVGLLGTADDWLNARTGDGISASQKLLWQTAVAGVVAWQIQNTYQIDALAVPFIGAVGIHPVAFILIAAFAIVATSNAVNITDGLDGLAGGTLIFAFIGYMVIAFTFGQPNLAVLCALIIGALLAFLWFNVHPAQIFMGDSGSLALGATLAVTAVITGQVLLLPLIGLIFVLETGSVILQVASVKLRGKRLFKFSPLHHHFELAGWDEEKITFRFWIVGALAALVGVAFYMATVGLLS